MSSKSWALKVSTLVVVTACFVVMGSSLLLSQNLKRILTLWGSDIQMSVYLEEDLSQERRDQLQQDLQSEPEVGKVELITQEKALEGFRSQLSTYAPDLAQDDDLLKLIPASFQVSLNEEIPVAEQNKVLTALAEKLRNVEGIDDVSYGQDWVEKYAVLVKGVEMGVNILGLVVLLAAIFVMSNVIRASVDARREEIGVMELIGATATTIRKPFLVSGMTLGASSSVLALIICFGLFAIVRHIFVTELSFLQLGSQLSFFSPIMVFVFIFAGVAIGGVGSYLCVRRINDGWAARAQV